MAGTILNRERATYTLTANSSFTMPNGLSADLNERYESRWVYDFEVIRSRGQVSAG